MADVDIGEELLKAVRADFRKELGDNDSKLAKILKRIQNGKGTMHDTALFAKECGAALSEAIAKNVTPDRLPNGQLYYNIADTILRTTLKDNYDLVNMAAQAVQEQTDSKLNIHLAPQQAPFPEDRIHKIINAAADQTADSGTIKRRLDSPVRNVTESFYDDFVEENAKFRDEAGLKTYIVRQTNGKCCNWCASLAGRYLYEDAPDNVFAKHDNCSCTCEYISDRYRQDVWSKRRYVLSSEQRKAILEQTPMPTRFTKEQAQNLQLQVLNGVANSANGGIIEERSRKAITPITDRAIERVPNVSISGYTTEQSSFIQQQHKELLNYSCNNNENKEVAFVIDGNFDSESRKIFTGTDDQLDFGSALRGKDLIVMHNHPRNSSFSTTDIDFFASNSNVKTLTIVKNNGNVEVITKSPNFDLSVFQKEYNRLYKKTVKTNSEAEKEKFVKTLLYKTKAGVIWNEN